MFKGVTFQLQRNSNGPLGSSVCPAGMKGRDSGSSHFYHPFFLLQINTTLGQVFCPGLAVPLWLMFYLSSDFFPKFFFAFPTNYLSPGMQSSLFHEFIFFSVTVHPPHCIQFTSARFLFTVFFQIN